MTVAIWIRRRFEYDNKKTWTLKAKPCRCQKRDPKGLYALAQKGELKRLTGIDDPYEAPKDAEIVIDGSQGTPLEAANKVLDYLYSQRYLPPDKSETDHP